MVRKVGFEISNNSIQASSSYVGPSVHCHSHLPPESRFQCDQCPKSYSQKWHLKQHQKRFGPCPHCRATFAQKSGLVAHIPRCPSQEGGVPEKQFSCEICGRKYSHKSELTRHLHLKHQFRCAVLCITMRCNGCILHHDW